MKIEIYLDGEEKDMEGEMEQALMSAEQQKKNMLMHKRVAQMLAKAAGRSQPNELDMEAAMDFVEDNVKYGKGM